MVSIEKPSEILHLSKVYPMQDSQPSGHLMI